MLLFWVLLLTCAPRLGAEVERLEITASQPVAAGRSFGLAGPYEKIAGKAHFSLDPAAAGNRAIVDLDLAPHAADGRVRFSADFYILRPARPEKGSGTLLLEVPNRGSKAIVRYFQRGAEGTLDPTEAAHFGDAFLLRRGLTLAWIGWQHDVPERPGLLRLDPVFLEDAPAGLVRADHVFAAPGQVLPLAHRNHRPYTVADPADPRNVLSVRDERLGTRRTIPRASWRFARLEDGQVVQDAGHIYLESGFEKGKIYEAVYVARRPAVAGLGLAAVRDFAAFLKDHADSPVAVERSLGMGISQTGRFLRMFLYQGFNRRLDGKPAFDGLLIHTAGAGRGSFNHRFGQPSRDAHPFSAFFYPTDIFPFTGAVQRDPASGRRDGLLRRPAAEETLPKIFFTNTGYEYWGRAASLIHTAVEGGDLPPAEEVRIYHLAGAQHFVDRFPPRPSGTRHAANPANFFFVLRALLVAMEGWVGEGAEPPPSRFPRRADQALVPPRELAFPALPGITVPKTAHQAYRVDYGPRFWSEGIVDRQPPALGAPFPTQVAQVDQDGNEAAGLRLPEIAVPLATYTPWNWRAEEIGAPDQLADFRGAFLPFPATAAQGRERGDPRRAVLERYPSREAYLGRYTAAALELVRQGYLLAEDLPEMIAHAGRLWDLVVGDQAIAEP